jgi:predicted DNA-binding transcriptional regulator YafY
MRSAEPAGQLGVLQAALFSGRRLRLRYRSSGRAADTGEPGERVVGPYGLVCKSGIWYLVADQRGWSRGTPEARTCVWVWVKLLA